MQSQAPRTRLADGVLKLTVLQATFLNEMFCGLHVLIKCATEVDDC